MLDTPSNTISDVRVQSFNIAYEYPVVFTRNAFGSGNRSLIDVLTRRESGKLHRCGIFVDEGVLSAIPDLAERISDYASFHARHLKIVGKPIVVPCGEVETYTWDVLPQNLRTGSKTADIAREISFCVKELVG